MSPKALLRMVPLAVFGLLAGHSELIAETKIIKSPQLSGEAGTDRCIGLGLGEWQGEPFEFATIVASDNPASKESTKWEVDPDKKTIRRPGTNECIGVWDWERTRPQWAGVLVPCTADYTKWEVRPDQTIKICNLAQEQEQSGAWALRDLKSSGALYMNLNPLT